MIWKYVCMYSLDGRSQVLTEENRHHVISHPGRVGFVSMYREDLGRFSTPNLEK